MSLNAEVLKQRMKERQLEKKAEESKKEKGGFLQREYEEIHYCHLRSNQPTVFRLLGLPRLSCFDFKGTDHKLVNVSWVLNDDGKWSKLILPSKPFEDKNFILWKVYNKITEGNWDGKVKNYYYNKTHKELFDRVTCNGDPSNKYSKGWYPQSYYLLNVIDRMDDWCKDNKHTKVLAKKLSFKKDKEGNDIARYSEGLPPTAYNAIFDEILPYLHKRKMDYSDTDMVITKQSIEPYYTVKCEELHDGLMEDEALSFCVKGGLTEEEKAYEMYNFDKTHKISTYHKIRKAVGNVFKSCDVAFNTNYFEELEALCAEEKAKFDKIYGNEDSKEAVPNISSKEAVGSLPPIKSNDNKRANTSFDADSLIGKKINGIAYDGIESLDRSMKAVIIGVGDDGYLIYSDKKVDGTPIANNDFIEDMQDPKKVFPEFFSHDPYSGAEYQL